MRRVVCARERGDRDCEGRNAAEFPTVIVVHYGEKVFGYTVAAAASVAGAVASRRIQLAHTACHFVPGATHVHPARGVVTFDQLNVTDLHML